LSERPCSRKADNREELFVRRFALPSPTAYIERENSKFSSPRAFILGQSYIHRFAPCFTRCFDLQRPRSCAEGKAWNFSKTKSIYGRELGYSPNPRAPRLVSGFYTNREKTALHIFLHISHSFLHISSLRDYTGGEVKNFSKLQSLPLIPSSSPHILHIPFIFPDITKSFQVTEPTYLYRRGQLEIFSSPNFREHLHITYIYKNYRAQFS